MEVSRLFDFIHYQKQNHPLQKAYGYKRDGQWVYFSTDEMIDMANKISRGLLKLGLKPGDKIATVVYKNRPEWVAMDIGMLQIGVINVPVYPTISSSEYEYIFNDSEVKYCVVGSGDLYEKVKSAQANVPSLVDIYSFHRWRSERSAGHYGQYKTGELGNDYLYLRYYRQS